MIIVIILGIMVIFLAWLEDSGLCKHGLKLSFGIIFLFLALRYNYGNDYSTYQDVFLEISTYENIDFQNDFPLQMEPGWGLLCWLSKPIGFFGMVAVLALVNCCIYYNFLKRYVPLKYYWFAVFIYVFNPNFMLIHSSAMRQSLAIALFVFSIDYLVKRRAVGYFICIGLASFFHTSALILLPVYLLVFFNERINKKTGVVLLLVFIALFLLGPSLLLYLNQFISSNFHRYAFYQDEGITKTGLGLFCFSALFILTLYYARFQKNETALIFKIAIISFMFLPLGLLIQLIVRVGMYFDPGTIIAFPIILMSLKKSVYKIIFLTFILFFTLYQFYIFFHDSVYSVPFKNYRTIFIGLI